MTEKLYQAPEVSRLDIIVEGIRQYVDPERPASEEMLVAARLSGHLAASLPSVGVSEADVVMAGLAYHAVLQGQACHIFASNRPSPPRVSASFIGDELSATTPIVLRKSLGALPMVYLRRMDTLEARLAERLRSLAQPRALPWPMQDIQASLSEKILSNAKQFAAVQKLARTRLVIVTGGPGSGKTFLLSSLLEVAVKYGGIKKDNIKLAAPTGRAARRMGESLLKPWKVEYDLETGMAKGDAVQPQTIHSLLRQDDAMDDLELLVIDEASMVDLMLFDKLIERITREGSRCTLVLIGDANQLPSVEVGSVLLDLCEAPALAEVKETLAGSQRSKVNPAIMDDAELVMASAPTAEQVQRVGILDTDVAIQELITLVCEDGPPFAQVRAYCLEEKLRLGRDVDPALLGPFSAIKAAAENGEPAKALAMADSVRVLCSQLRGPLGAETISRLVADRLGIKVSATSAGCGALLMVTRNHRSTGLANGDVGVVARSAPGAKEVLVYFKDRPRGYALSELPEFIPAFATTIHKSQGSEYALSIVVLSAVERKGFLNRQLVYTGITRAKYDYKVFASRAGLFQEACLSEVHRASGLTARLR
jgi:exodeoxyribonuclease V alpha subunit